MQIEIPEGFKEYALQLLGEVDYERFIRALAEPPSVSARLNPLKVGNIISSRTECKDYDSDVPWSKQGFYFKERPSFTSDPLFHAGAYYVQEASSMFLERAIQEYVTDPVVALDLCAAPGGKSTHTRSLLPEGSLLVCNEPIKARAQILAENITKWGHTDVIVTNSYPNEFTGLTGFFDMIITDVPCSGEGMFRKEEDAVTSWSMDNVQMCAVRQREILTDIWPTLKPGGLLIYSTCTLNQYEDEENVRWIAEELGAEVLPLSIKEDWAIKGNLLSGNNFPVYHFLQGYTRGEGFFLAVLRKRKDSVQSDEKEISVCSKVKNKKKKDKQPNIEIPEFCKRWIKCPDSYDFQVQDEGVVVIPKSYKPHLEMLRKTVNVIQVGVMLAVLKGKDWMPVHPLAMSVMLNTDAFAKVELSYKEAVAYLRKEALNLASEVPRGFILVCFYGLPLGFVKNIGNRANNLYPQEWRIRSLHLSDFCLKA